MYYRRPTSHFSTGGLSFCLSVCLSICLSVCLSVCLSLCLSLCMALCLSVCLSASLSIADVHNHILSHMSDITARNATARPLISLLGFLPFVFLFHTAGTSDGVITLLRILDASLPGTNSVCITKTSRLVIFRGMCCLFWEACEIHKHIIGSAKTLFSLQQVVHTVATVI